MERCSKLYQTLQKLKFPHKLHIHRQKLLIVTVKKKEEGGGGRFKRRNRTKGLVKL